MTGMNEFLALAPPGKSPTARVAPPGHKPRSLADAYRHRTAAAA